MILLRVRSRGRSGSPYSGAETYDKGLADWCRGGGKELSQAATALSKSMQFRGQTRKTCGHVIVYEIFGARGEFARTSGRCMRVSHYRWASFPKGPSAIETGLRSFPAQVIALDGGGTETITRTRERGRQLVAQSMILAGGRAFAGRTRIGAGLATATRRRQSRVDAHPARTPRQITPVLALMRHRAHARGCGEFMDVRSFGREPAFERVPRAPTGPWTARRVPYQIRLDQTVVSFKTCPRFGSR